MKNEHIFDSILDRLKQQVPAFPEYYSLVSPKSSKLSVKNIVVTDKGTELKGLCYIKPRHAKYLHIGRTEEHVEKYLKDRLWVAAECPVTNENLLLLEVGLDQYLLFLCKVGTAMPVSTVIGSYQECVKVFYNYQFTGYKMALRALCETIQVSKKLDTIGVNLASMSEYINTLLKTILRSSSKEEYLVEDNNKFIFNTKLLTGDLPFVIKCTVDRNNNILDFCSSRLYVTPYLEHSSFDRSLLGSSILVIDEKFISSAIKYQKLPFETTRKRLVTDVSREISESIKGSMYVEDYAMMVSYKGRPCLSFKFPESDNYLVCEPERIGNDSVLSAKSVVSTRTAKIWSLALGTVY